MDQLGVSQGQVKFKQEIQVLNAEHSKVLKKARGGVKCRIVFFFLEIKSSE